MRGLAKFIMRGRIPAIFIVGFFGSMSIAFVPLSIFSGAALGLVVLRKGLNEGIVVGGVAALFIIIAKMLYPVTPGIAFPIVFALWIPVVIGTFFLRNSRSQGQALLAVGAICALLVIGMHLTVGDVVAWWKEWVEAASVGTRGNAVENLERDGTLPLANGFVGMILGLGAMVMILFARWMQAILFNPGGFSREFHSLQIPRLVLPAVVAVVLLAGAINKVLMSDLYMISIMVYFFLGVSVLHCIVAKRGLTKWWIVPPYFGLLMIPQMFIPGLAFLGAADVIMDLRQLRPRKT